ncbi:MAG: hypothetical protein JW806_08185, partial [Sedimentisphaerales bacterium]|nr:hypothetical protein [Sedimentisphaerales bacterium]
PAGGGSGGSIKFVTGPAGSFTNSGVIEAEGGNGGDGNEKGNNTGGGGAGGRIAVFHGSGGYTNTGTMSVAGGEHGIIVQSGTYPNHNGLGLAFDGDEGTIHIEQYTASTNETIRRASAPTPKDGDTMVYAPSYPTSINLKWYSGLNQTAATDTIYCDTSNPPTTSQGTADGTVRSEHSVSMDVMPSTTYYMQVKTTGSFTTVETPVWSFTTVPWECLEPDFGGYTWDPGDPIPDDDTALHAGWPAWDQNYDCIVNNEDIWYFAQYYQIDRGGDSYITNRGELIHILYQWMSCRGRSDYGCENEGWPITGNFDPDAYN